MGVEHVSIVAAINEVLALHERFRPTARCERWLAGDGTPRRRWPWIRRAGSLIVVRALTIAVCVVVGCSDGGGGDLRQGGDTTVDDRTEEAFSQQAPNLAPVLVDAFIQGRSTFRFQWPSPVLGPLFNNDSCVGCHGGNGRGLSQIGNGALRSQALVRVSLPSGAPGEPGGDVPVPGFGLQLQDHATGALPEVIITLSWVEHAEIYGDGDVVMLRAPRIDIRRPDGNFLPVDVSVSYRQAPGVFGLGLLEAVPDETLLALADPDDADGDGISGRVNRVWDPERQAEAIGRFGHKATVPTLRQQTAGAFASDIGLDNQLFPGPDGMQDITDQELASTVVFVSSLGVPVAATPDATARRGRGLFEDFGCAACHIPTLVTGDHAISALAYQTIHPYTDLLLHDVGDLLTDARRDFTAEGVEWRTPPLWGLGLVQRVSPDATFLHDGRARSVAEAILWHGGEAMAAREAFRLAPRDQRDALIGFLQTL